LTALAIVYIELEATIVKTWMPCHLLWKHCQFKKTYESYDTIELHYIHI